MEKKCNIKKIKNDIPDEKNQGILVVSKYLYHFEKKPSEVSLPRASSLAFLLFIE